MMHPEYRSRFRFLRLVFLSANLLFVPIPGGAMEVNRIVAVVEDGVILESELDRQLSTIRAKLEASGTQLPPESIIRQQVLERMIINKLQLIQAERSGVHVDDSTAFDGADCPAE
jgi:peptidyl-prolyl cis-trans isomerase SurA